MAILQIKFEVKKPDTSVRKDGVETTAVQPKNMRTIESLVAGGEAALSEWRPGKSVWPRMIDPDRMDLQGAGSLFKDALKLCKNDWKKKGETRGKIASIYLNEAHYMLHGDAKKRDFEGNFWTSHGEKMDELFALAAEYDPALKMEIMGTYLAIAKRMKGDDPGAFAADMMKPYLDKAVRYGYSKAAAEKEIAAILNWPQEEKPKTLAKK